ncbi:MAG: anti-sigma F factor [Bacillota bacterium]
MSGEPARSPRWLTAAWGQGPDSFLLAIAASPDNLAFARAVVAAFAARLAFTLDEIEDIKLAVSEMVANAVIHAYAGQSPGPVWVAGRAQDGGLEVVVEDRGRGIKDVARAREAGYSSAGGDHLGIGFSVAETYMDQVLVDSVPGEGTCVRLFKRPAADQKQAGPR